MVSGEGRVSAPPDVAIVRLGASAKAATVSEASAQVAEAMNRILDSLRDNGVREEDIQTIQFSIYPEEDYHNGRPILLGFRVTHIIRAKVREVDRAGEVIDDAIQAAGNLLEVRGISFTIDDPTALQAQARERAMANAKAKAEQLARLAGVSLGPPIFISEGAVSLPVPKPLPALERGGEAAMPIAPGELEVVVHVQVNYAIR